MLVADFLVLAVEVLHVLLVDIGRSDVCAAAKPPLPRNAIPFFCLKVPAPSVDARVTEPLSLTVSQRCSQQKSFPRSARSACSPTDSQKGDDMSRAVRAKEDGSRELALLRLGGVTVSHTPHTP